MTGRKIDYSHKIKKFVEYILFNILINPLCRLKFERFNSFDLVFIINHISLAILIRLPDKL